MISTLRRWAKSTAEWTLGHPAVLRRQLTRLHGRRLVLSYHNIVSSNEPLQRGDRSLHLPLLRFRTQLDEIADAGLRVVRIDEPMTADAPSVAITFDDAYAGALTLGISELESRGLPCTVFVAPGLLGSDAPWWDLLAEPATGAVPPRLRDKVLERLAGDSDAIMLEAARAHWPKHEPLAVHRIATVDELGATLRAAPHATLGAHTWSHPNVAAVDSVRLATELAQPLAWLRARFPGRTLSAMAYPYGLESAPARHAAAKAGYIAAFRGAGGWTQPSDDPHGLPRLNVTPGISRAGFRARLAALIG